MMNEFVYCPRLFYFEHVEGVFLPSADTERGQQLHRRVDAGSGKMAAAASLEDPVSREAVEVLHARSVQLGSAALRVTAKLDLVEANADTGEVEPIDYKAGSPPEKDGQLTLWPTDQMQLGLQILLLRENGYRCHRGVIYYRATKQRVSFTLTPEIEQWIGEALSQARELLRQRQRPPPLVDSPKCVRCSLAPICLPDEMTLLSDSSGPTNSEECPDESPTSEPELSSAAPMLPEVLAIRRLLAPRPDTRALYLTTQGTQVTLKGRVLEIREKDRKLDSVRLADLHQVALFGQVQLTTQALRELLQQDIPVLYFSLGGWFYGLSRGHSAPNILSRQAQFRRAGDSAFCLGLARQMISGKIRNARTLLQRNAFPSPTHALLRLKQAAEDATQAPSLSSLLGIEGAAAQTYFAAFPTLLKAEQDEIPGLESPGSLAEPALTFDFRGRNRRPPTDPINALLSLAYSLLAKDCTVALLSVGLDPWQGFYHQIRPGRPALALDLMEEFRPLIADSAVITAVNNGMLHPKDFVRAGNAVNLSAEGRKKFFLAYEQRINALITHPIFGYKVCYRRVLELQARLLCRALEGEIPHYLPFLTR